MTNKEGYRYDGLGRRVTAWQPSSGTVTVSQYSQVGQLFYDENTGTALRNEYVYLSGSLLAKRETVWSANGATTVKYQHTDALGTPVAETNAAGAVIQRSEYDPYGRLNNRPLTDGIGYTGHYQDAATGLTYMQQRYYDPSIGRFISRDPMPADPNTGANFNAYWYAANNPYKFVDLDGRQESLAAERAYGAAVGYMLRDDPEQLRIWRGGEEAATTAGSGAEVGADMGEAAGEFIDAGDYSKEAVGGVALKFAMAFAARGKSKGGGAEHTKNARPSTKAKHEAGQARKERDRGGEKGDASRRPPSKRPPGHKGPWPPKSPPPPKPKKERE